jgi:hypothetical protein
VGKKVDGNLTQGLLYSPETPGPVAELDAQGNTKSRFVYASGLTPVAGPHPSVHPVREFRVY